MNTIDFSKEFFVIDSTNIDSVETRLYGYAVEESGVFEEENRVLYNDTFSGCGSYVYVRSRGQDISIEQDANGSYGLYLFRASNDYFAISNSFFALVDYLKHRFPLTFNREYALHLISANLCSHSYYETLVREIRLLDRSVCVQIDKKTHSLTELMPQQRDYRFSIDTNEGITLLDTWFGKWTRVFSNLYQQTRNITVNLSGGFDSRTTLLLMLNANIDLNSIRVFSFDDDSPVHRDDLRIATDISQYFGFQVDSRQLQTAFEAYSLDDTIDICYHTKMGFHQKMYLMPFRPTRKWFQIPGSGGELVRGYWSEFDTQTILAKFIERSSPYSDLLSKEIAAAIKSVMQRTIDSVCDKYNISPSDECVAQRVYRETRCRNHYGKAFVENYLSGLLCLPALLDPKLQWLRNYTPACNDKKLLSAVIFTRYCPKLLDFDFEGGRYIDNRTIKTAKEICRRFPKKNVEKSESVCTSFSIVPTYRHALGNGNCSQMLRGKDVDDYIDRIVLSKSCRNLVSRTFGEEVYTSLLKDISHEGFSASKGSHTLLALARCLDEVRQSREISLSNKQWLDNLLDMEEDIMLPTERLPIVRTFPAHHGMMVVITGCLYCESPIENPQRSVLLTVNFSDSLGRLIKTGKMNNNETYGDWTYLQTENGESPFRVVGFAPECAENVVVGISRFYSNRRIVLRQYAITIKPSL